MCEINPLVFKVSIYPILIIAGRRKQSSWLLWQSPDLLLLYTHHKKSSSLSRHRYSKLLYYSRSCVATFLSLFRLLIYIHIYKLTPNAKPAMIARGTVKREPLKKATTPSDTVVIDGIKVIDLIAITIYGNTLTSEVTVACFQYLPSGIPAYLGFCGTIARHL